MQAFCHLREWLCLGAASRGPAIFARALILVLAGSDAAYPLQLSAQSASRVRHYITVMSLKPTGLLRRARTGTLCWRLLPRKHASSKVISAGHCSVKRSAIPKSGHMVECISLRFRQVHTQEGVVTRVVPGRTYCSVQPYAWCAISKTRRSASQPRIF